MEGRAAVELALVDPAIGKTASAIESGMVAVSTAKVAWPELPFGGLKDSGSGFEGGIEGLRGYTVTKSVSLPW